MNLLESLKQDIAATLSCIKAYNLPQVCVELGLADGDESEAFSRVLGFERHVLRVN